MQRLFVLPVWFDVMAKQHGTESVVAITLCDFHSLGSEFATSADLEKEVLVEMTFAGAMAPMSEFIAELTNTSCTMMSAASERHAQLCVFQTISSSMLTWRRP